MKKNLKNIPNILFLVEVQAFIHWELLISLSSQVDRDNELWNSGIRKTSPETPKAQDTIHWLLIS